MVLTKQDVEEIVKTLLINNQKVLQGYAIASLYFKVGEFRTALKYVSRYLKIRPNKFLACKLQGECYEKLNRIDDALNSYRKAIDAEEKKRNAKRVVVDSSFEEIKKKVENGDIVKSSPPTSLTIEENGFSSNIQMDTEEMCTPTCTPKPNVIMDDDELLETTFEFAVDHFSTLDCVTCSKTFAFQNLLWKILVMPIREFGPSRTLAIFLDCVGDSDSPLWSCKVDVEFRLLSVKQNQYHYVQKLRHLFNRDESSIGFPKFLPWNDVVSPNSDYMQNDCVTVEVHVKTL